MRVKIKTGELSGFDMAMERLFMQHPYTAFFAIFIGMPLLTLLAVALSLTSIMLPAAWLCGWI